MALARKASSYQGLAEVLQFFTAEEIQNNLALLLIVDSLIHKNLRQKPIVKVFDGTDENNVIYYTNDKFLEVIEEHGLDGFIY